MKWILCLSVGVSLVSAPAAAQDRAATAASVPGAIAARPVPDLHDALRRAVRVNWTTVEAPPSRSLGFVRFDAPAPDADTAPTARLSLTAAGHLGETQTGAPVLAFEYSDGYRSRARIHKLASWATIPLFATQFVLGQEMFNNPAKATSLRRQAHKWSGIGVVSLFGVNSVTGILNLLEARKDPNRKTLRAVHAALMLVADAGFAASALTAPKHNSAIYDAKKNQHMALSYASISVATVSYLIMLFQ